MVGSGEQVSLDHKSLIAKLKLGLSFPVSGKCSNIVEVSFNCICVLGLLC